MRDGNPPAARITFVTLMEGAMRYYLPHIFLLLAGLASLTVFLTAATF